MEHLTECEHAFIKNGVVEHIFVFDKSAHSTDLLDRIKEEQGSDTVVCLCDYGSKIHLWSTWDGTKFTEPTLDYLYSIGIAQQNQAMQDAANAEFIAKQQADAEAKAAAEAKLTALGLTAADIAALTK